MNEMVGRGRKKIFRGNKGGTKRKEWLPRRDSDKRIGGRRKTTSSQQRAGRRSRGQIQ